MTTKAGELDAVIYVRESVDKHGDARAVERFEQQCRQLCAYRGLRVTRVLRDNDVPASRGNKGAGYAEVLRMMRAGEVRYVVVPVIDRFVRTLRDLEDVIDAAQQGGVTVLATSGDIDLSHDQGRLLGRILASVAKGEVERKGARQRAAAEQSARAGRAVKGCPRPFGWQNDRLTLDPGEADAIRWAADTLLGGGTISGITREWNRRGLLTAQGRKPFTRNSVAVIMRNPRLAGLSTYKKEIVGAGEWQPVLSEQQWRAVEALLTDPARKPPRGAYSLLGGLAECQCGTAVIASVNHRTTHVYRCDPQNRGDRPGPHCQQRRELVDEYVEAVILERLSRDDIAELIAAPPSGPEPAELRRDAASIRANLDEMAADRALGLMTRAQMLKATEAGNKRLAEIADQLAALASQSVLAPFVGADNVREIWDPMDRSRKRAVIDALARVVILPAGRGARDFNPETIRFHPREN